MKILVSVLAVAILYACASASLIDILKGVHSSAAFANLTHPAQIVIIELLAEAEAGELKAYVDAVGFQTVLVVIDSLPENEAHLLTQVLVDELNKEAGGSTTSPIQPVGRRDVATLLRTIESNQGFLHLSTEDRQLAEELVKAAESNTLTQFINHVGYARVLAVVNALPGREAHLLSDYITKHMNHESHTS